jgi:hypothetical protein
MTPQTGPVDRYVLEKLRAECNAARTALRHSIGKERPNALMRLDRAVRHLADAMLYDRLPVDLLPF